MLIVWKGWYYGLLARLQNNFASVEAILHIAEGSLDVRIIKNRNGMYDLEHP